MRLWSLDPKYLDRQGLVALWREALLAKNVLRDRTKGYRHHPQLERFRSSRAPLRYLESYLYGIWEEAKKRGYRFSIDKLENGGPHLKKNNKKIKVKSGQIDYEFDHLLKKLQTRDPERYRALKKEKKRGAHFLFKIYPGGIEKWEKVK